MTYQNRLFDVEFLERGVQHLRLHVNCDGAMIGTVAVAVARPIESESAVTRCQRSVQPSPILTRTGIAMNQNDRTAGAFNYKVQPGLVDSNEFRKGLRIFMSYARSEIALLESSSNVHEINPSRQAIFNKQAQ